MNEKTLSEFMKHLSKYDKFGPNLNYQKGYRRSYTEKEVISYTRKIYKELKELPYGYGAAIGYSMIEDDVKTVDDAINEATIILEFSCSAF